MEVGGLSAREYMYIYRMLSAILLPQAFIFAFVMSGRFAKGNKLNRFSQCALASDDNESGADPRDVRRAEGIKMLHIYHIVTKSLTLILLHSFRT